MTKQLDTEPQGQKRTVHGVVGEFSDVDSLMYAAKKVRDAGYSKWDTHTPFPVHGLDDAMGVRPTKLPWLILCGGLTGVSLAFLMQWWMNAHDYPFWISGKPYFSLPANVPIAFELTVLLSAFAAFFGTLGLNKLPELFHPLFTHKPFKKVTDDKFFVYIEQGDPLFAEDQTAALLRECNADAVDIVASTTTAASYKLPKLLVGAAAIAVALSLVPLVFIARARMTTSAKPPIHIIPDMDFQAKLKTQTASALFADGRAMRKAVAGTVARGELQDDPHFFRGQDLQGNWATSIPPEVAVTPATLARGQERYNIYCTPCHGAAGYGDGLVSKRAESLEQGTWVPPTSVHADHVRQQPVGELYNTIANGIRNMPAYGPQIDYLDRWAIVLYVKALQASQNAPAAVVPASTLGKLK